MDALSHRLADAVVGRLYLAVQQRVIPLGHHVSQAVVHIPRVAAGFGRPVNPNVPGVAVDLIGKLALVSCVEGRFGEV